MEVKKIRYGNASGVEILTDEQMRQHFGGKYDGDDCKTDDLGFCNWYGVYQPNNCVASISWTGQPITAWGNSVSLMIEYAGDHGWWCCNCKAAFDFWDDRPDY